ncbi:DUF805 domain-containing protein [Demequina sp. NBRC 110056]|uniref:DUF805 domain-containing protein n=1 Tax=Demequina sp. NBRC 110056 TaxID=1570345 RepID=UPI0013564553|nr:DUF805 domain-containing protein [Demequina sp. NBRC 110056]
MEGFRIGLSKYAQFSGRSRRREFWGFHITLYLIGLGLVLLWAAAAGLNAQDEGSGSWLAIIATVLSIVLGLAFIIPTLAVNWRRYQDINAHGGFSLLGLVIPLITFVVGFIPGTQGANQFGPDPKP